MKFLQHTRAPKYEIIKPARAHFPVKSLSVFEHCHRIATMKRGPDARYDQAPHMRQREDIGYWDNGGTVHYLQEHGVGFDVWLRDPTAHRRRFIGGRASCWWVQAMEGSCPAIGYSEGCQSD